MRIKIPTTRLSFADAILLLIVLMFCLSVFKNISYPLLWNDEAEGAMVAKRVLQYGYPKVHDGKNVVFMSLDRDIRDGEGNLVGYKKDYDAYIYMTWGNYYWAAIGAFLGQFTDDLYRQTALMRIPFAFMGLLGLLFFLFSVRGAFRSGRMFSWFGVLFFFMELWSIPLILHMREARYFSLVIFACGIFYFIYVRYFIEVRWSYRKYFIACTILFFMLYHVNFVSCVILMAILCAMQLLEFVAGVLRERSGWKLEMQRFVYACMPVIASLVAILPFLIFFETFKTSRIISAYVNFSMNMYLANVGTIISFFTKLDFIYTMLFIKSVLLGLWYFTSTSSSTGDTDRLPLDIKILEKVSLFSLVFFVVFGLMIARSPYLFVRHYIVMQPIMALIIVSDLFLLYGYLGRAKASRFAVFGVLASVLVVFSLNAVNKVYYVKEHFYEITHQYRGVLDYVIPYIEENYPRPEDLVIATDYEEFSYMFYLDSKVTIGYIQNNLDDDLRYQPDIIMYRKSWGRYPEVFSYFMQRANYERIAFPVADYPVNNIPELNFVFNHLFRTKLAESDMEKADIFVRVGQ